MDFKKIGKALLYPHLAVIVLLLPVSIALLVFSLIYFDETSVISIISYLFAFYMLVVLCFRVPRMIEFFKKVKNENKYIQKWLSDPHLRINISLYGSLIWNCAFAIFQLGLGFYHGSFWFYSMSAYYVFLAAMRFFLVKHTRVYKAREQVEVETKKYCLCGWVLLVMNLTLAVIIFFMVYWNRTFVHHEITTIMMATYTFVTFTLAIVSMVKYKKYNSPVYSAAKAISLIAACVSILTLETTMLTTFGGDDMPLFRQIMISITGAIIVAFTIIVAIMMIVRGNKNLKRLKTATLIKKVDVEDNIEEEKSV